eukprot:CAMPEP_0117695158 /NCGR_PEP_ID=MMETSP0804-20121206/27985_1 /TAXON_ID=1074897 /ORGANISM="Tetraselmis astigmatica, Strain CCMP880" /LENGTH=71 /DNA_ID=CAMNT_0005509201 /DNA_START=25 /DNA_END=238 /DNA_ORIENTATION=+
MPEQAPPRRIHSPPRSELLEQEMGVGTAHVCREGLRDRRKRVQNVRVHALQGPIPIAYAAHVVPRCSLNAL